MIVLYVWLIVAATVVYAPFFVIRSHKQWHTPGERVVYLMFTTAMSLPIWGRVLGWW